MLTENKSIVYDIEMKFSREPREGNHKNTLTKSSLKRLTGDWK